MKADLKVNKNLEFKPTIYWLAEHAGVSTATVSRAMRDDPDVNINTRNRIKQLAERVGWSPSPVASRLASGKTGMVAMLVPTIKNPLFTTLADHVIKECKKKQYDVLLACSEMEYEQEIRIIRSFGNAYADGFIIVPEFWQQNKSLILDLKKANKAKAFVIRSEIEQDCPLDSVYLDFKQAGYEATKHLLELGHRSIYYLGPSVNWHEDVRVAGYKDAMSEAGISPTLDMLVDSGMEIRSAFENVCQLFEKNRPSAVVVHSDYLAMAVLQAATKNNIKVPQELSIVSFDGIELSRYGAISLTTMAQPIEKVAKALVKCLFERISKNEAEPKRISFKMEFLEGQSTAAMK